MARKKKRSRRQGWVSKGINAGLIALGFSRVIEILLSGADVAGVSRAIVREATFGLSEGAFDLNAGLNMYSRAGAAIGLGKLKQYLMRHFPVR